MQPLKLLFKSKADKFASLEKQIATEDSYEVDDLFVTQSAIQKIVKYVQDHNEFAERAIKALGTRLQADFYYDLRPSEAIILIARKSPRTTYLAAKTLIETQKLSAQRALSDLCSALPDKKETILQAIQDSDAPYSARDYSTLAIHRLKP